MSLPSSEDFISHVAFDSVIFGFAGSKLKILILEYHNTGLYALPGGFVKHNEDLDEAVKRGLSERTGLTDIFLEQFHAFGSRARYQPEVMQRIVEGGDLTIAPDHWMLERFVSIAYFALINHEQVTPKPDALSDSINWFDVDNLPKLILDHEEIVNKALETLRGRLYTKPVGKNLLPERFTMKDLQQLHEAILGEQLRRTTFQRKMLSLDMLERHEKLFTGKAHKAPYVYSFK